MARPVREGDLAAEPIYREYKENQTQTQCRVLAVVPKNASEEFRIGVRNFNGTPKCEIRVFERDRSGNWLPTKRALVIGRGAIAAVTAGLCEVEQTL